MKEESKRKKLNNCKNQKCNEYQMNLSNVNENNETNEQTNCKKEIIKCNSNLTDNHEKEKGKNTKPLIENSSFIHNAQIYYDNLINSNDKKKKNNNTNIKSNTKKDTNKNENSKVNINSLEGINLKEQNSKSIHHLNKPSLSPSTSESISYKWKEDNSSYNTSSQSLADKYSDKNNSNFLLPKVDNKYDFLLGKENSMRSISQEKRNIPNNPKRKPILLINKDLASHIINENNLLLKKIKALHNYSYNVCYNTNQDKSINNQNSNSSLSINSINSINSNGNSNLSKKITYNINTYNGSISNSRSSTPSTDILFPPIQSKKNKRRYY